MKAFFAILARDRKVQALIFLIIAVVIADAGFYFLRTSPAVSETYALEGRLEDAKKAMKAAEGQYRLYGSFDSGTKDLDAFKAMLPKRSEYTEAVRKVYRLAREDRMTSDSFGTEKKEVQEGNFALLDFSMPFTGSYTDVRKFIYDVETSPLFLTINTLSLSADPTTGKINLTMGLSTYMRL